MACPVRIMIDTDPVYEQIKYAEADREARAYLDAHTHFFTYGENVGGPGWIVPLAGIPWQGTRPPVVMDLWPDAAGAGECWSTIATWENKGKNIEFGGETYVWSKHVNFLRFLDLPLAAGDCFTMAMLPPDADVERLVDRQGLAPRRSARRLGRHDALWRFHPRLARRVHRRQGHLCPAEERLVQRPQRLLPRLGTPGRDHAHRLEPLLSGRRRALRILDRDEALAAFAAVASDYRRHSRAARDLAAEYFASDRVLPAVLAGCGL